MGAKAGPDPQLASMQQTLPATPEMGILKQCDYDRRCKREGGERSARWGASVFEGAENPSDLKRRWQRSGEPTVAGCDALMSRWEVQTNNPPLWAPITVRSHLPSYKSRTDVSVGIHFHRRQGLNSQNSANL